MKLFTLSKDTFLYNLKRKVSKTNVFLLGGIFLFLLSSVITISTGIPIIKNSIEYTLFYKNKMMGSLAQLTAGTQITNFEELIGTPSFINDINQPTETTSSSLKPAQKEYVFVNKYFYLDALTDDNGNVVQFSVTTRKSDFNPVFKSPIYTSNGDEFYVVLGKSKFSDLPENPDLIEGCLGAHSWYYYESYYLGNPSNYQSYAFGLNMSGYEGKSSDFGEKLGEVTLTNCPDENNELPNASKLNIQALNVWRKSALVNTYLVTAPFYNVIPNYLGIGVDYNQVRILKK